MITNGEQLERNIDMEQGKTVSRRNTLNTEKNRQCVCMCMQVCIHVICSLNPSKEKKHDFEQAYIFNEDKGPTHILKNKKKIFVFRTTTTE